MQTEENTQRTLQIDPEFRNLLPTLTAEESAALEESIEREGCRDALIAWNGTLVDGHNRHEICTRRGFPFQVRQMDFDSREDVIIWICANQNARRNITPEQKSYLQGRRYEAEKKKCAANQYTADAAPQNGERQTTAERIASEVGVSKNTIERAGQYARAVDTLAADSPTIKQKILSGEINQPRSAIVTIAAKPEAERKAAVERMERGESPEPEVKTKECRLCGRTLSLDQFSTQGAGRIASYCRQCSAVKAANYRASYMQTDVRENMQILSDITDALHSNNGGVEHTIENVLNEIRLGGERLENLVRDTYERQPALMGDAKNAEAVNALLEDIAANINNLRRGRLSSRVFTETQNNGGTHEAHRYDSGLCGS
jgi:hypothetical protein